MQNKIEQTLRECVIKERIALMKLRKLKTEDALLMLEWMHDESVVSNMQTDFSAKTLQDCQNFIYESQHTHHNLHLAVVDDSDLYMGTVSLKNITKDSAEFAIVVRREAMGKDYSKYAMKKIIEIGFEKLGLKQIYWCVDPDNRRAVRFYDKNGYRKADCSTLPLECEEARYTDEKKASYIWYQVKC
ncbi:MAG TPA: GNAT family N-acetyltransferase [Lachnospiraceae bacterium]|nr:GNAT family N-acetyltransferase [Lachnospiraceae bacterium]